MRLGRAGRGPTTGAPCRAVIQPFRLFVVAAVLAATGPAAFAQNYTQQQLQEIYAGLISAEGLRPETNAAGNLRFRREGRSYVIHVDERDPLYVRLTMAFAVEDKSAPMRQRRLEGCNTASSEVKVVKCFLDEDGDPTFATEMFVIVPGDFKLWFNRALRAMDSAFDRYTRKVGELR
jgi:hypothetical protein